MSEVEDQAPVLEEELEEGGLFLQEGDYEEALMRAARALTVAPDSVEALALADAVLAAMPDALAHLSIDEEVSFGIVAMRARAMAWIGRWVDAADLALQVATYRPTLPYAPWAAEFLHAMKEPISTVDADRLVGRCVNLFEALVKAGVDQSDTRPNSEATLEVLSHVGPRASEKSSASYLRCSLLRRLGRAPEALEEGQHAFSEEASWELATELALTHRDLGDTEGAVRMFRRAAELDPTDATTWLDLGEMLVARGRLAEGCTAYEQALRRNPRHRPTIAALSRAQALLADAALERPRGS